MLESFLWIRSSLKKKKEKKNETKKKETEKREKTKNKKQKTEMLNELKTFNHNDAHWNCLVKLTIRLNANPNFHLLDFLRMMFQRSDKNKFSKNNQHCDYYYSISSLK